MSNGLLQELDTAFKQLLATRYTQASSMALVIFDYLLTFPDEHGLYWTGRWTFPRILFFMNRYLVIVWQIFDTRGAFNPTNTLKFCESWGHNFLEAAGTISIIIIHMILSFRIYGLYGRSKNIAWFLTTLIGVTGAVEIFIEVQYAPQFDRIELGGDVGAVCVPRDSPNISFFWIPVLVFEITSFSLVVFKGFAHWNSQRGINLQGSGLFQILVRDSVGYFFVILLIYVSNAITWFKLPPTLRFLIQGYTLSAASILATRMLINIRLAGTKSEFNSGSVPSQLPRDVELSKFAARSHHLRLETATSTTVTV